MKSYKIILASLFVTNTIAFSQKIGNQKDCIPEKILDQRDLTQNIKGETMGQKLESLLFWTQDEKERRFPLMQSIYPSIGVAASSKVSKLQKGKTINPTWDAGTTIDSYIKDNHIGGLIVLKNGKIILEKYNQGQGQNTLWTSFSVAKSISSMLVGVALKEGHIKSMDDTLDLYIPELKGFDYGKISVRQLLTMTSGIGWNEDYQDHHSDVAQMYLQQCRDKEPHILTYMKPLKAVSKPGTVWNYSTGETDLVGILIQKATGQSLAEYLSEKIWKPYGMQQCAYWLADECSGLNIGGSGLSVSLRDYARLGQLMLDSHQTIHQSIFDVDWLKNATSPLFSVNEKGGGYGYLWWRNLDGSFSANGIFGQMIYINPKENLVIVQVAAWPQAGSKELSKKRADFVNAVLKALK